MRSGIGLAQRLTELGVPVFSDLEGVGENLKDHAYVGVSARVRNIQTINAMSRGLPLLWEIIKYFTARKGIISIQLSCVYLS